MCGGLVVVVVVQEDEADGHGANASVIARLEQELAESKKRNEELEVSHPSINQPINQSINQSTNQAIKQSINQSDGPHNTQAVAPAPFPPQWSDSPAMWQGDVTALRRRIGEAEARVMTSEAEAEMAQIERDEALDAQRTIEYVFRVHFTGKICYGIEPSSTSFKCTSRGDVCSGVDVLGLVVGVGRREAKEWEARSRELEGDLKGFEDQINEDTMLIADQHAQIAVRLIRPCQCI